MCNPRVRSSQPRCASRGPNRNGADTKLRTPNTPDSASNRYVRRQPGARDRPSGWHASRRRPHNRRSAAVSATRTPTAPNAARLPLNAVSGNPDAHAAGPQPRRNGPGCAGGRDNPNAAARRGSALRADAAHNAPRALRHPSRAHSSRPREARDCSPRSNAPRSHSTGAFPISRSRAHTHRRHGHPLQTVPSAGLIERPQEKNRVDALR